jgi:hypothetical protein
VSTTRDRLDDNSSRVVKVLCDQSRYINPLRSVSMTANDILDKIDIKIDLKRVHKLLEDLCTDPIHILEKVINT